MKHCFLALFILASTASIADASCRRVVRCVQCAPVVEKVIAPVVATTIESYVTSAFVQVPVPVYPVYGVGYGYGMAQQYGTPQQSSEIQALRDEIAQLRQAINPQQPDRPPLRQGQEQVQSPTQQGPGPETKLFAYVQQNCIKCHGPTKQEAGLMLVTPDGRALARLSAPQLDLVFRKVARGDMPKGGPPVSQEALDLFDAWAESARAARSSQPIPPPQPTPTPAPTTPPAQPTTPPK